MNPEEIKRQITNQLDDVERQVEQHFAAQDKVDEDLKSKLLGWASARPLRDAITRFMDCRESSAGLHTLALFAWWRDELPVLTTKITTSSIATSVLTAWSGLTGLLQPILTSINQGLWTLLATLLTVKEWSVSGDAGVSILGLKGTAKIEITFT